MGLLDKIKSNKNIQEYIYKDDTDVPKDFINIGCLSLNILFSGRLDGGIPVGKISQIAAPSASAKSFIGLKVAKNAQKKGFSVIYLDTEMAYDFEFANNIGIDDKEIVILQTNRIEETQQVVLSTLKDFTKEERKKILLVIDSWGGLVTSKTEEDATIGKDVSDMTISKKKNSFARLLTGLGVTVFVVNQIYDSMDQYNPLAIGGGRGIYFASSSIVLGSSKAKHKENSSDTEVSGAVVSASTRKGRLCKENSKLKFLVRYDGGIDPFFGLLEDALEGGYIDKPSMGWYSRPCVPNDKKHREKEIYSKDFWSKIIQETDFKNYIERKYTFSHNEIIDEDFDWDEVERNG